MKPVQTLQEQLGEKKVTENKVMTSLTTLRTPAVAEIYTEAYSVEDWKVIVQAAKENNLPLHILGGGSNVAIMSETIPGITVKNCYRGIELEQKTEENATVRVKSGTIVSQFVRFTTDHGLHGFEYHLGLPGTVGGAVCMNSKWTRPDAYFGDWVTSAVLMNKKGEPNTVDRDYFAFSYGWSRIQETQEIILDVVFTLPKEDPEVLKKRAQESLAYRKETQPHGVATSGCFFKNITESEQAQAGLPTKSAGYLIDHAGLKGKTVGGFQVSEKHANFIVNTGDGTLDDLKTLIQQIKNTVKKKYDIELRAEVLIM